MSDADSISIIETKDGSHTLLHAELDETYHSSHGALTESKHVFLKEGLEHFLKSKTKARILEVGFGTGLNALLTWKHSEEQKAEVEFTTLEPYPIPEELISKLNYVPLLGKSLEKQFSRLHSLGWNKKHQLSEQFRFQKLEETLEGFEAEKLFDVLYFDAFAPQKQPELWEIPVLEKCYELLSEGGILVTYCAKGQFKRDLKEIGFEVERVAGPPNGKREMTRATKP